MPKNEARKEAFNMLQPECLYESDDRSAMTAFGMNMFDYGVAYAEGQWVRCDERLPAETGWYADWLVTVEHPRTKSIDVIVASYYSKAWRDEHGDEIELTAIAWRPLPEPYKEDK